jgi:hypothetical protein
MLRDEDLVSFIEIASNVERNSKLPLSTICSSLQSSNGGLLPDEVGRLASSLEAASYAGLADPRFASWAKTIYENLGETHCVTLDDQNAWRSAIMAAMNAPPPIHAIPKASRAQRVGEACARLRARGRKVRLTAYGPTWDDASLRDACAEIDSFVRLLGGPEINRQIAAFLREQNRIVESIWLFGELGLGLEENKSPSPPFGWLLGLSAKHAVKEPSCRKAEKVWRTLIVNSSDIAATFDCERYGQFEQLRIPPSEIDRAIKDTLSWRALFSSPQTPRLALSYLRRAFHDELTEQNDRTFKEWVEKVWNEFDKLSLQLSSDGSLSVKRRDAERHFATLLDAATATIGKVNAEYLIPVGATPREDTRYILFSSKNGDLAARPLSFSVQAFCETIFTEMWSRLNSGRASKVSGRVLERAIAYACEGKADWVQENLKYDADGKRPEFDVVACSGDDVTSFEVKAKSLTAQAQTGDTVPFYDDYAKSFLPLVLQLARHERHIRDGSAPVPIHVRAAARVEKVAVSPVSYGQVGDRLFQTAIQEALFRVKLDVLDEDQERSKSMNYFNASLKKTQNEIIRTATNDAGEINFHEFFLFTHWLDIGQLLFALERAERVHDALRPIRHASFQTRDFWSEYVFAARIRQGSKSAN